LLPAEALPFKCHDTSLLICGATMPISDRTPKNNHLEQEKKFRELVALATGFFQDDVTLSGQLHRLDEAVLILDISGTILFANPHAVQMFGFRTEEIFSSHFSSCYPDKVRAGDKPAEDLAKAATAGRVDVEGWLSRKDGSLFWAVVTLAALSDEAGNLRGFMQLTYDASERKGAVEGALREAEINFAKAFQATPSILVIASLVDGKYKEVNEAFEEAMGYRRDEVIGRTSLELSIWQNPEDRVILLQQLAEGKKVRNLESGFRSKSGEIIVGLISAEIIEIGAERCLLSLVNDITPRKKMEEELRQSESRYRRLYNDTPVMLHSIDLDGRLVSVSNFWLETLGYERSEVLGRTTTDFLTPASRSYATEVVLPEFFRTGSCKDIPYQFVKKSGEIIDVLLSAIAERDNKDNVIRSLAVLINVTERKRLDEEIDRLNTDLAARAIELEAANRELEAFNYMVAHDLRKPLTVVSGYCQLVREQCGNKLGPDCRGYLQVTYEGACRMNRLIDTLLNFSRLAHVEPSRETVDLSAMAHEVARELQRADPAQQVTFRIGKGITVNGDANLLRVVLDNLLGNAFKYTARQGKAVIEFGLTEIAGKATCFVRDNGPGFDMAYAEKLFAPFKRLDGGAQCEGFGIGLATVERIIKRHSGQVWAESEPGKGATFYFTL